MNFARFFVPLTSSKGFSFEIENKTVFILNFAVFFVPLTSSKVFSLESENKSVFILHFARFFVPLTSSKVLSLKKTQIIFGFLFTYSYLCSRVHVVLALRGSEGVGQNMLDTASYNALFLVS